MMYCPECDWQLEIAKRMVRKDRKQRWVYLYAPNHYRISDEPIPKKDAISVYWMPIHQMVAYSFRPKI
mgnify:CR=1